MTTAIPIVGIHGNRLERFPGLSFVVVFIVYFLNIYFFLISGSDSGVQVAGRVAMAPRHNNYRVFNRFQWRFISLKCFWVYIELNLVLPSFYEYY